MAVMRTMKYSVVAGLLLFIGLARATNYIVGGPSGGWDMLTDQKTWASSQTFVVGDNLVFQYSSSHDVSEVTKTDYDSCQANSPIQTYTDGSTVIPLTSPGKRYFICSVPGHCSGGMKLEVTTLAASSAPAAAPALSGPVSAPEPVPRFDLSLSPGPAPALSVPSPSESPIPSAAASNPDVPTTEEPSGSSTLTRTSADLPNSSAKNVALGKGLGLAIMMLWALAL